MRYTLAFLFVLSSTLAFSQQKEKLSLVIQLQPELTFHKNNYAYRSKPVVTKLTPNIGFEATVQYHFSSRLFAATGVGFISRRIKGQAFFDHPGPTNELIVSGLISYRTLQFPLDVGYSILYKPNTKFFIQGGITYNLLLNADYAARTYPGPYKKNYGQGFSLNAGPGADFGISKKIKFTLRLTYSFINTVKDDELLFSQDEDPIDLPHNYLRSSVGVKILL